jgi:CTP:molybdopterin cytidylyltransferase MocA
MGSPKPLLQWGNETLIEYQVRQLREAGCDPIIVVLGAHEAEIRPLAEGAGARAVINERFREGRASSVRVGMKALGDKADAILVLNVDQPRPSYVHGQLLAEMARTHAPITVPVHGGRRGHPALFTRALVPDLREVDEATQGMRDVLRRHEAEILEVAFDTPMVILDINTPEEYESAKAAYFQEVAR